MAMHEIVRNILLGVSLAAPLGPAGIAVIQNGLRRGFLYGFLTGLGVTLADATYSLIVFFGLSSFIGIPVVKALVWTLGALVLLYLGAQSIREARRRADFHGTTVSADRNPVLVGYLVNISNPIAVVWWVGIFGSLLGDTAGGVARIDALFSGSAILAGILSWHSTMALLTHWGKRLLNQTTAKYISVVAGIALILFGICFASDAVRTVLALLQS